MNSRLARTLTRLYPTSWRERYGAEFTSFLERDTGGVQSITDVIWSVFHEHLMSAGEFLMKSPQNAMGIVAVSFLAAIAGGVNLVGALIESPSLYPNLTGRENLEVIRRLLNIAPANIVEVLQLVQLTEDSDRLVRTYSLGMKQRLGLAVALLGNPKLLVLDEPANGLDPAGVHDLRDLLRSLARERGATVVLSSHLLAEVEQIADCVAILDRGHLLFQGTLGDFQALRSGSLTLRVDRPENAVLVLRQHGWDVDERPDGALSMPVSNVSDAAAINALLGQHGVAVHHLAQEQASLETLFLRATGRLEEHG